MFEANHIFAFCGIFIVFEQSLSHRNLQVHLNWSITKNFSQTFISQACMTLEEKRCFGIDEKSKHYSFVNKISEVSKWIFRKNYVHVEKIDLQMKNQLMKE